MINHYMRFVDGFWRMVSDGLRIALYKSLATRLMAWNDRLRVTELAYTGQAIGGPLHGRELSSSYSRIVIPVEAESGPYRFDLRAYEWRTGRWIYDIGREKLELND
jgi:hypothetical protein